VNLKGQLTVRQNGTFEFEGDYGIETDTFDFDPKPSGQRGWVAEKVVRALNEMPGTPYPTRIVGRLPVRERGHW
jgi:hypothetical protein